MSLLTARTEARPTVTATCGAKGQPVVTRKLLAGNRNKHALCGLPKASNRATRFRQIAQAVAINLYGSRITWAA